MIQKLQEKLREGAEAELANTPSREATKRTQQKDSRRTLRRMRAGSKHSRETT